MVAQKKQYKKDIFQIREEKEYLNNQQAVDINKINNKNRNALLDALAKGNKKKAEWLIRNGIDIHYLDQEGCNALFYSNDDYKITVSLVDRGIDINNCDPYGMTPLFGANTKVSEYLISKNININALLSNLNRNVLFYTEDPKKVKLLIKNGIEINQVDTLGQNALFEANLKTAKILIKEGININQVNYSNQENILFRPIGRNIEILKMLIERNINVNHLDYLGGNALQLAPSEIVNTLIEAGVDVHNVTNFGFNALFFADLEKAKILVSHNININQKNDRGENPLVYADVDVTNFLIRNMDDLSFYTKSTIDEMVSRDPASFPPAKIALIEQRKALIEKRQIEIEMEKNKAISNQNSLNDIVIKKIKRI